MIKPVDYVAIRVQGARVSRLKGTHESWHDCVRRIAKQSASTSTGAGSVQKYTHTSVGVYCIPTAAPWTALLLLLLTNERLEASRYSHRLRNRGDGPPKGVYPLFVSRRQQGSAMRTWSIQAVYQYHGHNRVFQRELTLHGLSRPIPRTKDRVKGRRVAKSCFISQSITTYHPPLTTVDSSY